MKAKALFSALFAACALSASAFTIDFTGLNLSGPNPFTFSDKDPLNVGDPGNDFGSIVFTTDGPVANVNESLGSPAIIFDETLPITLSFISGSPVTNVMIAFIGLDAGENPTFVQPLSSTVDPTFAVSIPAGTVGIQSITFDRVGPKVPEPSTAILGAFGALALLRRRR